MIMSNNIILKFTDQFEVIVPKVPISYYRAILPFDLLFPFDLKII